MMICESDTDSSTVDLAANETVELVPSDSLSTITADRVDNFDELVVIVAVLQLLVDVSQIVKVKFSLGLHVQQSEVLSATLLAEGVTLNHIEYVPLGW